MTDLSILIPARNGKGSRVPIEQQKASQKARKRAWVENNKERVRQQNRARKAKNRDKTNAQARASYQRNRDKQLARHRLGKYGMDEATYNELVAAQDGRCLICGNKPEINLSVDHNHATGKVRGLICNPCNIALAKANDSPALLRAMADYLEKYNG